MEDVTDRRKLILEELAPREGGAKRRRAEAERRLRILERVADWRGPGTAEQIIGPRGGLVLGQMKRKGLVDHRGRWIQDAGGEIVLWGLTRRGRSLVSRGRGVSLPAGRWPLDPESDFPDARWPRNPVNEFPDPGAG